ncbi:MAG: hypothetical protein K5793_01600 [Nitrosarchaeum sp.]|nr:hypothetical protein [Nitrosarchaeum sp.]
MIISLESLQVVYMMIENIFFGILSSIYLVTLEIGELAFFAVLVILMSAVVIKIIKNKKRPKT